MRVPFVYSLDTNDWNGKYALARGSSFVRCLSFAETSPDTKYVRSLRCDMYFIMLFTHGSSQVFAFFIAHLLILL